MATINPQTGSVLAVPAMIENLKISLLVDSGAVVSGAASLIQPGDGRKMATFGWCRSATPGEMEGAAHGCGGGEDGCPGHPRHKFPGRHGTEHGLRQEACSDAPSSIGCMGTGVPQEITGQVTTGKSAQASTLESILRRHSRAISRNYDDLGRTSVVTHRIETGEAQPIKQPPRRLPLAQRSVMERLVGQMLESGVIKPASGPWSSPVVLVRKKNGLNAVSPVDAQPLPRIDDTLDALAGSQWFSTLDLASGYWQVEVAEPDREKTASTPMATDGEPAEGLDIQRLLGVPSRHYRLRAHGRRTSGTTGQGAPSPAVRGIGSLLMHDIEHFVGTLVKMGIIPMPRFRMYWSADFRVDSFANRLTRNRFMETMRYLHFNDNSQTILDRDDPNYDRLFIPYKGKPKPKQYLPCKPHKWGFKVISRAAAAKKMGILSCGTIRPNRLRGCPLLSEKDLKSKGKGAYDFRTDAKKVAWYDNRRVTATSTYLGIEPKSTVKRWDGRQRKVMDV
ncbi:Retrovirus-related Pol polyprotein from transposon opus [Trichinella zimbabwensis]|uniref:Retrovirus-related Pol polyprotein from transposon opus n=1 Tax=Trichinella zimbabwensis TaxID=268475 RepID=A0A0V1GW72_9BILA|nr:Retrovirus-related Pol polyprotein from transposon opus [Trichinella zimbabwensis]